MAEPLPVTVDFRILPQSEQLALIYAAQQRILDIAERSGVSDRFMAEMNAFVADSKRQSDAAQALFAKVGTP